VIPSARCSKSSICSWDEFLKWSKCILEEKDADKKRWIFRGQSKTSYSLETSLEREANRSGIDLCELKYDLLEKRLINEFRRRAHHYISRVPDRHDLVEWLALMQHYGAPTRLLDWSYSPFIALHFAVAGAQFEVNSSGQKAQASCALWAMESVRYTSKYTLRELGYSNVTKHYARKAGRKRQHHPEPTKFLQDAIVRYVFDKPTLGVFVVNPFMLSERSSIQQGVHLMPGDITKSFEENLLASPRRRDNLQVLEIVLTKDIRNEFLKHLHRMNIDHASLFPGLQGYAKSMAERITFPELLSL
jgi:hypothetical protein